MATVLSAREVTLMQLRSHFGLQRSNDPLFFSEWQTDLPSLSSSEKQTLATIREEYLHLSESVLLEPLVKMVVLSPLLKQAEFYRAPFFLAAEREVSLTAQDKDWVVRGRIDILIFRPEFWVLAIEAKRTAFSLELALPQVLAYMLASEPERPVFGFLTNGHSFQFLKLAIAETSAQRPTKQPVYDRSYLLSIDRENDLEMVLQGLKKLRQRAIEAA